jgi:hypothetical protein
LAKHGRQRSVLSPMAPFSKRYNPEGRFVSFLGLVL